MHRIQPGILDAIPRQARYLVFSVKPDANPREGLVALGKIAVVHDVVVGVGQSLLLALKKTVDGLHTFPAHAAPGIEIPSTPFALWCWLRGEDRGELVHRTRTITQAVGEAYQLEHVIDAFRYGASLDLSGYEDGTENPKDEAAVDAAIVQGQGGGMDGSSFVAVQQWRHDLGHFQSMSPREQDQTIGRRKSDNEELVDAPPSAHVKRTAQESFDPAAFVVRRSMPWADGEHAGLVFVAFGKNLDAFEALLRRMVGAEDGVTDALFRFTRPISGSYFWCPPVKNEKLDLRAVGII